MRRWVRLLRPVTIALVIAGCGSSSSTTPSKYNIADSIGYLTAMVNVMQTFSYNRNTIDWTSFRSQVLAAGQGATTLPQLYPAIQLALGLLGDHHSFFQTSAGAIVNNPTLPKCSAPTFSKTPQLPAGVGYVYSGTCFVGCDGPTYMSQLQSQIRAADSKGPLVGWIVDLRSNGGGDFHPMVTGLGSILGDGIAGYFIDINGAATSWSYTQGVMKQGGGVAMTLANPYALASPNPPVAVLVDSLTASSGEATFVSFIGRPNTRSFGAATCGLSSGNTGHVLSDGSLLYVMDVIDADRTQKTYGGPITPDVVVSGADQAVVDAAAAWLTSLPPSTRVR